MFGARWDCYKESFSNIKEVNHWRDIGRPEDRGDPWGEAIYLPGGINWQQNANLVENPYPLVLPDDYGAGSYVGSRNGIANTYIYTGVETAFIRPESLKFGFFGLDYINISAPNGAIVNVECDSADVEAYFAFSAVYSYDNNTIGYIGPNVNFDSIFSGFLSTIYGITFEGTQSVSMGPAAWWTNWDNEVGSVKITIDGTCRRFIFMGIELENKSNEYAFDIKQTSEILGGVTIACPVTGDGKANVFVPGSKTQTNKYWTFGLNPGIQRSTVTAGFYSRANTVNTVPIVQGDTQDFQSAQDAGGGKTQINTTNTGIFVNGDDVWFPNSIYAGKYTISNLIANTSFEIDIAFIADDSGEYHRGWTKIAGTSVENEKVERAYQSANNEVTFTNLERTVLSTRFSYTVSGAATADRVEFCIMKNNDILSESIKERTLRTNPAEGFVEGLASVIEDDTMTAYARNMDHPTRPILCTFFNFIGKD